MDRQMDKQITSSIMHACELASSPGPFPAFQLLHTEKQEGHPYEGWSKGENECGQAKGQQSSGHRCTQST